MSRVLLLTVCLLGFQVVTAQQPARQTTTRDAAEQPAGHIEEPDIRWKPPVHNAQKKAFLAFEGAVYKPDPEALPLYVDFDRAPGGATSVTATLENEVYIPLTEEEKTISTGQTFPENPVITSYISLLKKQPHYTIEIIPFRKNPVTGQPEKLLSFDIRKNFGYDAPAYRTKAAAATHSVLRNGTWFKLGVTADGLYSIDHEFLVEMGIDPSQLQPGKIGVFGQPGGMAPFQNSAPKKDDLKELAITVTGADDGSFDEGDRIIFYGQGPHRAIWADSLQRFVHHRNHYSDTTYYYLTTDVASGLRVGTTGSAASPTHQVGSYSSFQIHELEQHNLLKSGRRWFGESFEITASRDFSFGFPDVDASVPARINLNVVARSQEKVDFQITTGSKAFNLAVGSVNFANIYYEFARENDTLFDITPSPVININITCLKNGNTLAWLDYIEVTARSFLRYNQPQLLFRDPFSVGSGHVAGYTVQGSGLHNGLYLWDVTNPLQPVRIQYQLSAAGLKFNAAAGQLKEFTVFDPQKVVSPAFHGTVANQNLHASPQVTYVIVSHPTLIQVAEELADMHRADGMSVLVTTTDKVYNEFAAGSAEAPAIRDFMKMFYDRATGSSDMPKYLLLMGDGSFDNKTRGGTNSNLIPTYESEASLIVYDSYVSDDFYAMLDDNEGNMTFDKMDIAVGRIPAKNIQEARGVLEKIKRYRSAATMKPWRNSITFLADDEDFGQWVIDSESCFNIAKNNHPEFDYDKIYIDAYRQEYTPGGQRYPEAQDALLRRVEKGTLILNYIGHGGETGLGHEQILTIPNINDWTNIDNLPLFFTATCEFSRYDDYTRTSAGELVLLNPNGGSIAMMSTVRVVSSSPNLALNTNFFSHALDLHQGELPTLGDLFYLTKSPEPLNSGRNFTLLGDPALVLNYPKYNVVTKAINGLPVNAQTDTIQALSKVTVTGMVTDLNGQLMENFNGVVYPLVFDKESEMMTLGNDPNSPPKQFSLWKNAIYKGKASVVNGEFSFTFIVPKDINYAYGFGRISYYAENTVTDAHGYTQQFVIGGTDSTAAADNTGPEAELYMNDLKFVFGGMTDENPNLLGVLHDEHGINTSGTGIGHDITAVLDGSTENTYVLNDYYEADLDSYQSGKVLYPFRDLSEGRHTLRLKAWDVYNNSAEAYTEFVVAKSAEIALDHVLNYPNPFTTYTEFWFEHNQPGVQLDVQIQIFTVTGKLVRTLESFVNSDGYRANPIPWDGRDQYGDKIGRGVYVYRLKVKKPDGTYADKFEKLVILQ